MLCKYIKGRLGNQLFQYSSMRGFQDEFFPDIPICLSFKKVEKKAKKEHFGQIDSLEFFNTKYLKCNKIKITLKQHVLICLLSAVLFGYKYIIRKNYAKNRDKIENVFSNVLLKNNIIWKTSGYTKFDIDRIDKNKDVIFYGYFEAPSYFDGIKDKLYDELKPKKKILNHNKELLNLIKSSNSICVSIRRGDFVSNKKYSSEHYICDKQYFEKAIKLITKKVNNPVFVVFSDDITWVKKNMKFPKGSLFEKGDDPVWEKLRLMYSCKHFILSNSSFSWWSYYLSKNDKKIVVAPRIWNKKNDNRDLYNENWILI